MTEIKRILCPVDFSDFSRHAVGHAVAIARWYDATVTALHVVPPVSSMIPAGDAGLYPPFVFTPEDLAKLEGQVLSFVRESAGDTPVDAQVLEGSVAGVIAQVARDLPADLLVMGTHGRSGFDWLLLGSVTEKMLRKAPCPVLTVPRAVPEVVSAGPGLFARILCAVDFSPASLRALAFAESLAKEADANLTVMHVLEPVPIFEPVSMGGPGGPPIGRDEPDYVRRRLGETVSREARIYSHVSEVVTSGRPYREILREAAERRADLIVMGAHGGAFGLAAFGSTTNHVVRQAACPVLTLRG